MHHRFGLYLKTFNRISLVSTTIDNILKYTPNLTLHVVSDDLESENYIKSKYSNVIILPFTTRLGSPGTWEKCIQHAKQSKFEYAIVFEDDCFPYKSGWLEMLDHFLINGGKNQFTLLHLLPNKPYIGIYEEGTYLLDDRYYSKNQTKILDYHVLDMTMDSNPFNLVRVDVFDDEPYIVNPNFKTYGFWHSEIQLRLFWKGANKYRSACLKQLELFLNALDYTTVPNVRPGGISHQEKSIAIEHNKRFFTETELLKPTQELKKNYWINKLAKL